MNIFKHHCFTCNEYETIATVMKVSHEHTHTHADVMCCCSNQLNFCCKKVDSKHTHLTSTCCTEEYKRVEVNATVFNQNITIKIAQIDLFQHVNIGDERGDVADSRSNKYLRNVILYVPDEPSSVENCVFLL